MQPLAIPELLTTGEAAELTNRPERSVRDALAKQILDGQYIQGRWLVPRDDLLAWDRRAGRRCRPQSFPWETSAKLLAEYGPLTADELGRLAGIHAGNARKHLAILAKEGRAERLADGQWVLTALEHHGAA